MRKILVAVVTVLASIAVASIGLAACSSSGGHHGSSSTAGTTPASSGGSAATITISSFAYSGDLTVTPGEKVTVINKDSVPHTLTAKGNKTFDSGTINGGGTGSFTAPTAPGTYPFGCRFHPDMKGTLTVKA